MGLGRVDRAVLLTLSMCCWVLSSGTLQAASFPEFVDPHPDGGNQFGATILPLSTGNVVITSPLDDAGSTDAGAVYLFNGATGALISTLRGSTPFNQIGSGGVTALTNGHFVVASPNWDNGATADVGAVTWGDGTSGVGGLVSSANSLVGSTASDRVGSAGVTPLSNGNYVVRSLGWHNGAVADAGAVTWGSGAAGVTGSVSSANSLVGSTASDQVGSAGVTPLPNGSYVVRSPNWDNGAVNNAGAATWGNGTSGVSGVVSSANSLIGSIANDQVSSTGVTALTNGNYVVTSTLWDSPFAQIDVGAVTWGSGTSGVSGVVSSANSLVGFGGDAVGSGGVTALTNGNYVVASPNWDNGATTDVGAVTWANGTSGVTGPVTPSNSLVGSTAADRVGGVTALTNGNYVVGSPQWSNGGLSQLGAATWASGTSGVTGTISPANSLVGSTAFDGVGRFVTALSNGNYVVVSSSWRNGGISSAGAVTWANGTTGVTGTVSAANSLVGSTATDFVGGNPFGGGGIL